MKNLLLYFNPESKFSDEHDALTKIQIDNSLDLGWTPEDILLVTNFPYEYRGIKAYVLNGEFQVFDGNRSSKVPMINQLFRENFFKDGEVYWFHDHDAFQLALMRDPKLGDNVAGFTDHGWDPGWNAGSFFFTAGARKMFGWIHKSMVQRNTNEQDALTHIWGRITGYKMLNSTYNVGIYRTQKVLQKIDHSLLVAHFHPNKPRHLEIFRDLIPERLKTLFKRHLVDNHILDEKIACLKSLRFDSTNRYREWSPYLSKYHCDTICEIGIRQGFHFDYLIAHKPKVAVAVDCWIDDGVVGRNDSCYDQAGLERQYEKFKNNQVNNPFVKIVRAYSFDAVKEFPDEYFDFIFIDADHTYPGISRDLVDWWPKVKRGGAFTGHDYSHQTRRAVNRQIIKFGVVEAVDEFVKKNNITTFFTLYPGSTWGIIKT